MSLVIHVYLVGICNSLLVEKHISVGICFSSRRTHVSSDMMGSGRHITRDMCFLGRGNTYNWKICVSLGGEHISLRICVFQLVGNISPGKTYH